MSTLISIFFSTQVRLIRKIHILGLLDARCCESDCRDLKDITNKLNKKIANEIKKGGSLDKIRDRLGNDIYHDHSRGLTNIDGWIQDQGDEYCKSGKKRAFRYSWASCIKITCNGKTECIGADKISHFFQQGYMLYEILQSKSREHAIAFGAASEGIYESSKYSEEISNWLIQDKFNFHGFEQTRLLDYINKWGNIGHSRQPNA